jgi:uncharacterized protein with GYD domain
MPTYVTLVKLTSEGQKTMSDLGNTWQEGVKKAEQMGIKTISAYGLLGPYDMMFIYGAPNEKAAAGMPLSFTARGTSQTETWTAIPMEEFVQLTARIKG